MDKGREIRVPREIVNDDAVQIAEWHVESGQKVKAGDIVVLVETSKAMVEVLAEADGYIEIVKPVGADAAIGEVIGRVLKRAPTTSPRDDKGGESGAEVAEKSPTLFSKKARIAMAEHGIDPAVFSDRGIVRENEVLAYLAQAEAGQLVSAPIDSDKAVQLDNDYSAADRDVTEGDGDNVWSDAKVSAGERGSSLAWLAFNYFWRTWLLSNLVRWAPRFIILHLHRWRGVKIGRGCFIDPAAIIETAHPGNISIGDDVRVAAQAVIMTHIKPPHFMRNNGVMKSTVSPVTLEDHCFVGVGALVMPGVTIGRAAVVASGAVVLGDVPSFTLVAGNPAKVVKKLSEKTAGEDE